jgi:hypothetical protein
MHLLSSKKMCWKAGDLNWSMERGTLMELATLEFQILYFSCHSIYHSIVNLFHKFVHTVPHQ